jgi:hypothetical protein
MSEPWGGRRSESSDKNIREHKRRGRPRKEAPAAAPNESPTA